MRPEVEKFYTDKLGGIGNIVLLGKRRALDSEHVLAAAEDIYKQHNNGGRFKSDRILIQRLLVRAHEFKAQKYETELMRSRRYERALRRLERRVQSLERPWYIKLWPMPWRGCSNFGDQAAAMPYLQLAFESGTLLQPFYVDYDWRPYYSDFDICSSIQMALLFKRVGFNIKKHYRALQGYIHEDGGVPQSTADKRAITWGAKFWLDLQHEMGEA